MKLYLIDSNITVNYDEFYGVIVCAKNKAQAMQIAITHCHNFTEKNTDIEKIGKANKKQKVGVILESFNAG